MIRPCQIHEIYKLLPMAQSFFDEANEPGNFNPDQFCKHWHDVYAANGGVIFVDDADGKFIAALGMYIGQSAYSGILEANETFYYATGGTGGSLLKHVVKWADGIGINAFYLHHRTGHMAERLGQFYNKLGFTQRFSRYLREA